VTSRPGFPACPGLARLALLLVTRRLV